MIVAEAYAVYPERRAVFAEYNMQLQTETACQFIGICISSTKTIGIIGGMSYESSFQCPISGFSNKRPEKPEKTERPESFNAL